MFFACLGWHFQDSDCRNGTTIVASSTDCTAEVLIGGQPCHIFEPSVKAAVKQRCF